MKALLRAAKAAASAGARRAESLLALVARRKARIVEDFFDIGEALRELRDHKLFQTIGYSSFRAMLDARGVMSHTQAVKLIASAKNYEREQALSLGLEKAYALVRCTAATPAPDSPKFLSETGAKIGKKPAGAATVRDIAKAAGAERRRREAKRPDPEAKAAAETERAVRARLVKRAVREAAVAVARKKTGWRIRVEIDLAHAHVIG